MGVQPPRGIFMWAKPPPSILDKTLANWIINWPVLGIYISFTVTNNNENWSHWVLRRFTPINLEKFKECFLSSIQTPWYGKPCHPVLNGLGQKKLVVSWKAGYPNSWMVFFMVDPTQMDDFGGSTILGNHPFAQHLCCSSYAWNEVVFQIGETYRQPQ